MNALYELHEELQAQGIYLHISALAIQLEKAPDTGGDAQEISTDNTFAKLSQYYRDWRHFYEANDEDVAKLLKKFWNKFLALEEKSQSLRCLGLDEHAKWVEVQQQYRCLCQ